MSLKRPGQYSPAEIDRQATYFRFALDLNSTPLTHPKFVALCDFINLSAALLGVTSTPSPQNISLTE